MFAVWNIHYWSRYPNLYSSCCLEFTHHYFENLNDDPITYIIGPEEMWYSKKNSHLEANSILKHVCAKHEAFASSDIVCIKVEFFYKKPVLNKNKFVTKHSYRYKTGEKYWCYNCNKKY